jgi:hypothetical protein
MMKVNQTLRRPQGDALDIETIRQKQQALMKQLVERRVRSRAQQLYESRGQGEGQDLQDWFQAESEVLQNTILAPLYRKLRNTSQDESKGSSSAQNLDPTKVLA